jgi:hypothetical protein
MRALELQTPLPSLSVGLIAQVITRAQYLQCHRRTDMPTRKRKGKDNGDYPEPEREPHHEEDSAVKTHEEYLKHRLGGGEPASPEAYRRAVEQFEKLPGAMRSTPEIVRPEEPTEKPVPKNGETGNNGKSK